MDLLTHALSGVAIATVGMSFFKEQRLKHGFQLLLAGGMGGMFPDIDAITLWSKFDSTFGKLFHLSHLGKEIYSSKLWYGHHNFFHSMAAGILIALIVSMLIKAFKPQSKLISKEVLFLPLLFFLGFLAHLFGDIPTPAGAWGGVNIFWPSNHFVGGYGKIWWWNNYDIFLILFFCIVINLTLNIIASFRKIKVIGATLVISLVGVFFIVYQINARKIDYNYTGFNRKFEFYESKSKEEQKRILGKNIFKVMSKFDNMLCINF